MYLLFYKNLFDLKNEIKKIQERHNYSKYELDIEYDFELIENNFYNNSLIEKDPKIFIIKGICDEKNNFSREKYAFFQKLFSKKNQKDILVFTCFENDKIQKNPTLELLKKNCKLIKTEEKTIFKNEIARIARNYDSKISIDAYNYLILIFKNDLDSIENEIKKVSSIEKNITRKILIEVNKYPYYKNDFELLEALIDFKNKKNIAIKMKKMIKKIENYNSIIHQLIEFCNSSTKIYLLLKEKKSEKEIIEHTKYHPYKVKKTLEFLKTFKWETIKKIIKILKEIDYLIKHTNIDPFECIEIGLIKIFFI